MNKNVSATTPAAAKVKLIFPAPDRFTHKVQYYIYTV